MEAYPFARLFRSGYLVKASTPLQMMVCSETILGPDDLAAYSFLTQVTEADA